MKKDVSIKRNFIMNAILSMSAFIFPLITYPYVSRILGPEGTGKVSLAVSWSTYFNMFAQMGIPTYGIRACAKVRDDKLKLTRTAQELLIINLVLGVIAYGCFFALVLAYPRMRNDKILYIIVSSSILFNAIGMEWLFKGLEQYSYITKRSIVFKAIAVAAMFVLIRKDSDYVWYGVLSVFAASASNVMNFFYARKFIIMKPVGNYCFRKHFKAVGVFFAMSCATTVYTNLDTVMLGHMTSDTDVGYYNAAVRIKNILVSIVTSLGNVLLPRASYYIEKGRTEEFKRITKKAIHFVLLFAAPLTVYFMIYASYGIYFLAGRQYSGAIRSMQVIMPTLVFIGLTNIMGIQILVPTGREKEVLYSEIAGAVVDAGLNMILIPSLKATGAAIGTLVAEFVVLLVQYVLLRKELNGFFRKFHFGQLIVSLGVASVLSFCVRLINMQSISYQLQNFIVLAVSAIIFFGVYFITMVIFKEPIVIEVKQMIGKRINRS